ncbi:hypothetical protein ACE193_18665 [Bernardetia sp. OM2101]|uniref:hypothetical protein n=1 Tax=Bernardetia sp. OM2101 TaxID=3344876 RepID=UPI0035D1351E
MKNKTLLSVSVWLLVVFLSVFYFTSQKNKQEKNNIALDKSIHFIENQIAHKQAKILKEHFISVEESGFHPRDTAVYNPIERNLAFSDSLYRTANYEWKYLKNHTVDSFYNYVQIKEDDIFLDYQNYSSLFVNKLHKLALYRLYSKNHLLDFNKFGCGFGYYDKFQINFLLSQSVIVLEYTRNGELQSSTIYQGKKSIQNLYFDVEKDTTIYFEIETDYFERSVNRNRKKYQLKIKAGQKNDFEIKEVKQ